MHNQIVKLTLLGFILLFLITGCSKGSSNPIAGGTSFEPAGAGNLDTLPIIAFDGNTAVGVMGGFNLTISPDGTNADLVPMRTSAIGESYIVSGTAFFTMTPCANCLKIDGLELYGTNSIALIMSVKHPFTRGEGPCGAMNRLDLDVFDLAVVVQPLDAESNNYSLTGIEIYTGIVPNADGYTKELTGVTCENSALPFKICYENENNNRFETEIDYQRFNITFNLDEGLTFNLYLTMGYGASAKKPQRLDPTYYAPEFNRKSAWKVEVDPVSWFYDNPSTVTIDIYDWNHGAEIDDNYPDPANLDKLPSSSDVQSVFIEVPGMTSALVEATIDDTSTNGWDDPLTYTATFTNENDIDSGVFTGLVKVLDSRTPGSAGASDSLAHNPDGGPDLEWHEVQEFATYQVFTATVVSGDGLIWAKRAGGSSFDGGFGITRLSDNSTVVTGLFDETATFGPGESAETIFTSDGIYDIFIAKYNPDGTLAWAKRAGGSLSDGGYAITTLSDNSTIVTGYFQGSATFGPGESAETTLTSAGNSDIFIAKYNTDGTIVWAKRAGGSISDWSNAITPLSDNSTIVTGVFEGSATFGPGESAETTLTSAGSEDIFIAKYNWDGTIAWAKRAGGLDDDRSIKITILSDNSTIVTGFFQGSATFGPGESAETSLTSDGSDDIFIAKFNTDGTIAWAKRAGGSDADRGHGITTLPNNSTIVTGYFSGSATFGWGESAETSLTSDGSGDIFIAKYNTDGTIAWAKRAGGTSSDSGNAITSLSDNSIFVTGQFEGSTTFGWGEFNQTILTSAGYADFFIARYNSDGTIAWAKRAGGSLIDTGFGITILLDNSIVTTGYFGGSATFGDGEPNQTVLTSAGNTDIYIARFAPTAF